MYQAWKAEDEGEPEAKAEAEEAMVEGEVTSTMVEEEVWLQLREPDL